MKISSVLLMVILVAIAVTFIYVTVRINSLEQKSRDKSSEIDGSLWDRAFQLSKLVALLTNKGIEHSIEVLDVNTFGLGMSATLQATYSEKIDVQDVEIGFLNDYQTSIVQGLGGGKPTGEKIIPVTSSSWTMAPLSSQVMRWGCDGSNCSAGTRTV